MSVDGVALAAVVLSVLIGSMAQATTGFGIGLTVLPVLAVVAPTQVPAGVLLLSIPLSAGNAWSDRGHIDRRAVAHLSVSRLLGIGLGVVLLTQIDSAGLRVMCLVVATFSLVSFAEPRALAWMSWWPAAGVLSGFMGSIAGVGGPPLAAAFRDRTLATTRATSGLLTVIGACITLGLLLPSGLLRREHLELAALLMPVVALGTLAGRRLVMRHAETRARLAIFCMVALGVLALGVQVTIGLIG